MALVFVIMFKLLLLLPLLVSSFPTNNDNAVREYAEVLTLVDNNYWVVNIGIGTPSQFFNVVIDTTTASLWVGGQNCTSAACKRRATFKPNHSSTYIDTPLVVNNIDHNGKEVGFVGSDSVMLGSLKNKSIIVPGNTFALLNDIPLAYQVDGIDGLLGLGYPGNAIQRTTPPFYEATTNYLSTNGIFTIWLEDQNQTSDLGTHGVIYFGNADPLHCPASPPITIQQTSGQVFKFTTTGVYLNTSTLSSGSSQTTIDTTSPYISVSQTIYYYVTTYLGLNKNGPTPAFIQCDANFTIRFSFSNGLSYNATQLNLISKLPDGRCTLNIVPITDTSSAYAVILGHPFLRGKCAFFDMTNQRIGFNSALSH